MTSEHRAYKVPVRTILATIGLALATLVTVVFVMHVQRVLVWMLVALVFTVALCPAVDWLQQHVSWCRRPLATRLPEMIADARDGRGPVGILLERTNALEFARDNSDRIREFATGPGAPALNLVRSAVTGIIATISFFVIAYLAVLEGPKVIEGTLALFPPQRAERIRRVGGACAKTVTGYISGNLLISATLGAVVAAVAALIHSVPAAITVVIFFVVYQQVENHLLQPVIFSRTVRLNPLTVLIALLLATELAGILGALLAIPVAGVIQVVLRDIWHRRGARQVATTIHSGRTLPPDEESRS